MGGWGLKVFSLNNRPPALSWVPGSRNQNVGRLDWSENCVSLDNFLGKFLASILLTKPLLLPPLLTGIFSLWQGTLYAFLGLIAILSS